MGTGSSKESLLPYEEAFEEARESGRLELSRMKPPLSSLIVNGFTEFKLRPHNITFLDLSFNSIRLLPEEFTMLRNLKQLDLSHNAMQEIPKGVCALGAILEGLNISHNKLKELPALFHKTFGALKSLRIQYNEMREVPPDLVKLTYKNLQFIALDGNFIDLSTIRPLLPVLAPYNDQFVPQQIIKKLWLGSINAALEKSELKKRNIKYILSIIDDMPDCPYESDFVYKHIALHDMPHVNIMKYFAETNRFIGEGRKKGGVLVHCNAGISRSGTCVLAYLMKHNHISYSEAKQLAAKSRPCIRPNDGFKRQLVQYAYDNKLPIEAREANWLRKLDPKLLLNRGSPKPDKKKPTAKLKSSAPPLSSSREDSIDEDGWIIPEPADKEEDDGWILPDEPNSEHTVVADEDGWIQNTPIDPSRSTKEEDGGIVPDEDGWIQNTPTDPSRSTKEEDGGIVPEQENVPPMKSRSTRQQVPRKKREKSKSYIHTIDVTKSDGPTSSSRVDKKSGSKIKTETGWTNGHVKAGREAFKSKVHKKFRKGRRRSSLPDQLREGNAPKIKEGGTPGVTKKVIA
eukprot:TRINITY_DN686_c0_g1_i1.p1 TRINITY_DN686_c0_g1~~TRINITY_DN686_c0_g1_i1.p1  ORF type:complete len:580 (-),score=66.74 TRINITY_DN686_c0_g1_i1:51-1763(-)